MNTRSGRSVLFVITSMNPGGAQKQILMVGTALVQRGWRVKILALLPTTKAWAMRDSSPLAVIAPARHGVAGFLEGVYLFVRELRALRPQVVVTFLFHANIIGRIVGRAAGAKRIVSSLRGAYIGGEWTRLVERWSGGLSTCMVVNSRKSGEELQKRGILTKDRWLVIPNAVDVVEVSHREAPHGSAVSGPGMAAPALGRFHWVGVGRLHPVKGWDVLIRALAEVQTSCGDCVRLSIVGHGAALSDLERLVEKLSLTRCVSFAGFSEDLDTMYECADAVVLSSRSEGLPNVLLEAGARGLPVVTTDVGGCREIVCSDECGWIVPADDVDALSMAMIEVMTMSDQDRIRRGSNLRRHVMSEFGVEPVIGLWEELLTRNLHLSG